MVATVLVVRTLGQRLLDLVFPPRCAACGAGGDFLCPTCAAALSDARPPRCQVCWRPGTAGLCRSCRAGPPAFDRLRAAFVYQGVARELVHALKFRGVTAVAPALAALMAPAARDDRLGADLIVPVPLSGLRRRLRGYNQSEALASALGRELGLPVLPGALRRRRHGAPQARSASAEERRRNVAGAFQARGEELAGRRVLLVDDVTTTGATLGACAAALREGGAARVWALAFARED